MWFIQPKRNYLPHLPWERLNEPEVMSWQIRVRDYNTLVANIVFLGVYLLIGGFLWALIYFQGGGVVDEDSMSLIVLSLIMMPIVMSMTHQTSIIGYRLTEKGYEKISWKPQIDSVKPVMKWTAIISGIAVLVASFINPYFLIGAVGPAIFGFIALAMGNSSGYQKLVRDEEHEIFSWDEIEEIVYWGKRRLIGLRVTHENGEGVPYSFYHKMYCEKGDVKSCLDFIREKTDSVTYVERKLIV